MSSLFRSWITSGLSTATTTDTNNGSAVPSPTISPPSSDEEDDGDVTETERNDDDRPPLFPSPFSAQRASTGKSSIPAILTPDSSLMPPPPPPFLANRIPGVSSSSSAKSTLALPPSTTKPPTKPSKKREKVALAPGHSPLDWASLKASGEDLRGVDTLMRIPPSVLKQHRSKDDAWSAFNGKVYNITPYLDFHPGGVKELMRVAGRDGTKLFAETHAWVNADFMLDACMVGFLVPEPLS
ncbi:hypothetical protein ONZ45_g18413 [Pleurotus djamor]|nr:hypothetical protein ONZ45_g18413 [Pleurotus djamor]